MLPATYSRFVLNERPETNVTDNTLRKEVVPLDLKPGCSQVLVKTTWISLDPAMRGWMSDKADFLPPVALNATMRATGIGIVIELGPESTFKTGDLIWGFVGLAEYAVLDEALSEVIQLPDGVHPEDFLGPLGITGLAAYFGLNEIGHLKAGQTLVVSAAAGATGSMACQLGKLAGANVVAIAGSDDKCAWLKKEIGCDVVLNYKNSSFHADFEASVDKLDVYFDNVGGAMLDYMISRINQDSVIVLCGAVSQMNKQKADGLTNCVNLIAMRARMQGFIVTDFRANWAAARQPIIEGLINGSLKRQFHVIEGLDSAAQAYPMLFTGGNTGKLVVHVTSM